MSQSLKQPTQTPAEKLNEIRKRAKAKGTHRMSQEAFAELVDRHRGLWANEQEIDEFVVWLRRTRDAEG